MFNRKLKDLDIFTEGELQQIHEASLEILQKTGIQLFHKASRDLLAKNGLRSPGIGLICRRRWWKSCLNWRRSSLPCMPATPRKACPLAAQPRCWRPLRGAVCHGFRER